MLIPQVVGFKLTGRASRRNDRNRPRPRPQRSSAAPELSATGSVLRPRLHQFARQPGHDGERESGVRLDLRHLPIDAESGSTTWSFTGRAEHHIALVEGYAKEQGLWHDPSHEPVYSIRSTRLGEHRAVYGRTETAARPRPLTGATMQSVRSSPTRRRSRQCKSSDSTRPRGCRFRP